MSRIHTDRPLADRRRLWRRSVLLGAFGFLAALACATLFTGAARGDEPHFAPPAEEPTGRAYAGDRFAQEAIPAVNPYCGCNYWIVSSRCCPQKSHDGCCPHCTLEYYHCGNDGYLHRFDEESFRAWLYPGAPVCVIVHGSFVDWDWVVRTSHNTYHWLRSVAPQRPLNVVFYTWPSEGFDTLCPQIDVAILGERSEFNGHYLAQFACRLPDSHPVSLVGHSHGARTVAAALHLMGGGLVDDLPLCPACRPPERVRAVLAAGAIDHHWLSPGERYGRSLCVVEGLLNLRNKKDIALALYCLRKPFGRHAIARSGVTRKDVEKMGALACRVAEMDVTELIRSGHMWPNYYDRPEIAAGIIPWVYFD